MPEAFISTLTEARTVVNPNSYVTANHHVIMLIVDDVSENYLIFISNRHVMIGLVDGAGSSIPVSRFPHPKLG
jgi:hypothetical protein